MTTILLLVSRRDYLDQIFAGLEFLQCDKENTNLLVIVDGDTKLFTYTRNTVSMAKFKENLCVQFKSVDNMKNFDMAHRRQRIANIHNFAKQFIGDSEYLLGLEDDTIYSNLVLEKLLQDYMLVPFAGMIQGYELGRWGIPYYGAWQFDDIYKPKYIKSLEKGKGLEECDAGGMYCFITKTKYYKKVDHKPFDNGGLGPDVNYGVELRRMGLMNYTDWTLPCNHHTKDGVIKPYADDSTTVQFVKNDVGRWRQKTL